MEAPRAIGSAAAVVRAKRRWLLLAAVAFAAVNFLIGLGSSSLFVDEAFSWVVASHPVRALYAATKLSEVAPPGYYAFLHVWLQLGGSITESWMRLPSAIAGVLLVAAGGWLAKLLGGWAAALSTAAMLAVSPLVLTYSQQVRAYVFVMLAVTVAVACAVRAFQPGARRERWVAGSCVAAVAAIWLHYTCLPVIIALAVWVAARAELSARVRSVYVVVLLVAQALVTPLLIHQSSTGNAGADAYSHLTATNAFSVLGAPVDGRYGGHLTAVIIATVAILAAAAALSVTARRDRADWLLVAGALLPPLALFAVTIVAKPVLISRYCTVATPFALSTVGVLLARRPRFGAIPAVAILATGIIGSVRFHQPVSRYPAIGAAYRTAGRGWRPGDVYVLERGIDLGLTSRPIDMYYAMRYLPPGAEQLSQPGQATLTALIRRHRRIWLADSSGTLEAALNRFLAPLHYRVAVVRRFTGDEPIQVTLIAPTVTVR